MNIAYLVPAPGVPVRGPSGASAHVRGLARGLRAAGHGVALYAARDVDRRGAVEEVSATITGAPGWPSWLDGWRELSEVWAARKLARRVVEDVLGGQPLDLVIERHSLFSDAGWKVSSRLGCPWVLEVNAPPLLERGRFERVRRPEMAARWERDVLLAAPVVVTVSDWLVRWLREEIGARNIHKVWNGCEGHRGDRAEGRRILHVPEGKPVVGFAGSMRPWHGVERLATIAAACGARLALLGPAPSAALLAGLPEDVIVTGTLPAERLAHAVAALDLGVVPYPADAPPWFGPLKVLDYRAQGVPVVGTDVGETAALIGDGGVVVPAYDIDALVEAARTWIGRKQVPWVRSWRQVGEEVVGLGSVR